MILYLGIFFLFVNMDTERVYIRVSLMELASYFSTLIFFSTVFLWLFKKHIYHFCSKKKVIFILKISILFIKPLYIQWPRFVHSPRSWQVWKYPTISQMKALGFRNVALMAWFWAVFSHRAATPRSEECGKSGASFGQNPCHFSSPATPSHLLSDGVGGQLLKDKALSLTHATPPPPGGGLRKLSWWLGATAVGKQWHTALTSDGSTGDFSTLLSLQKAIRVHQKPYFTNVGFFPSWQHAARSSLVMLGSSTHTTAQSAPRSRG